MTLNTVLTNKEGTPLAPATTAEQVAYDNTMNVKQAIDSRISDEEYEVLNQRMNNFASLPDGSTTGDAELADIRVGHDGTQYDTAGEAVRGQVGSLSSEIDNIGNHCYYSKIKNEYAGNYVVKVTGEKVMSESYRTSKPILLKKGDYLKVTARVWDENQCIIYLCNESGDFVSTMRNGENNTLVTVSVGGYDKDVYFAYCGNINDKIEAVIYTPIATKKELDVISGKINDIEPQIYHVGEGQQYETFTECIRALKDNENEKIIYIHSGEYDIFSEIGGSEFAKSILADSEWKDCNDIVPGNTTIIGLGYVKLLFKPSMEEIGDIAVNLLSPINVVKSVRIENIEVDAENCRYAIHDDGSSEYSNTKHEYVGVTLFKSGEGYASAFGGGVGNQCNFYFKNCIFKSSKIALSFHNQSFAVNSVISVDNSALISDGECSVRLGSLTFSTNKSPVIFNMFNCYLNKDILFIKEGNIENRYNSFLLTIVKCSNIQINTDAFGENITFIPNIYN